MSLYLPFLGIILENANRLAAQQTQGWYSGTPSNTSTMSLRNGDVVGASSMQDLSRVNAPSTPQRYIFDTTYESRAIAFTITGLQYDNIYFIFAGLHWFLTVGALHCHLVSGTLRCCL